MWQRLQRTVITYQMPKGGEHHTHGVIHRPRCLRVITYQMPKGGEHSITHTCGHLSDGVITYQMPKGGEHAIDRAVWEIAKCDYIPDAERR